MNEPITPHSYYRDREQARRMSWILRRAAYRRTGRRPGLVWADTDEAEKASVRLAMAALSRRLKPD